MTMRPARSLASAAALLSAALLFGAVAAWSQSDPRQSGYVFMSAGTRALQDDDSANPAMLSVADGEALWSQGAAGGKPACAGCHGNARASMRGVAARYPAPDEPSGTVVDLQGRINLCRQRHQNEPAFAFEGRDLLALASYVGLQSRGLPISPPEGERMDKAREEGRILYTTRMGQLDFSCANCHDDNAGRRLGAAPIPQAHPTGYPIYRLEWQAVGSLQRRFRNCLTGVRAEPFGYGTAPAIALESWLAWRARGMAVETPAVRP